MNGPRSALVLAAEFPARPGALSPARPAVLWARALATEGLAVHVICPSEGESERITEDRVVVHRLARDHAGALPTVLGEQLWAATVARNFTALDELVDFDLVLAADPLAALGLELRRSTSLVALAPGRVGPRPLVEERSEPEIATRRALELLALRRADLVLAPSPAAASELAAELGEVALAVVAPPTLVLAHERQRGDRPEGAPLRLLFAGALDQSHAPELTLATLGALREAGVAARATILGADSTLGARRSSYRRVVCRGAMEAAGLADDSVEYLEALDDEAFLRLLARSDALLSPFMSTVAAGAQLEAIAAGLPVLTPAGNALSATFGLEEGVVGLDAEEPADFAALAAAELARWAATGWPPCDLASTARRLADCSPQRQVERLLQALSSHGPLQRVAPALRQPAAPTPALGVVVLASEHEELTARTLASLLHHTEVPLRCALVGSPATPLGRLARTEDPRVVGVHLEEEASGAARFNAGLAHLGDAVDYVAFAESVEFLAHWWEPYVGALEEDPFAALAVEEGRGESQDPGAGDAAGIGRVAAPVGGFFVLSRSRLNQLGRFVEGLTSQDAAGDLARRARRQGGDVLGVGAGRVVLLAEAGGAEPSPSPTAGPEIRQGPFVVLADASRAAVDPGVLGAFGDAFTREDEALLVLYGPGLDDQRFLAQLRTAAQLAKFDLDSGPRVVAMLPAGRDALQEQGLASEAFAALGAVPEGAAFAHLPALSNNSGDELRLLAAQLWRAQRRGATQGLATVG